MRCLAGGKLWQSRKSMMPVNLCIVGAGGFIGSGIVRALADDKRFHVTALTRGDADFTDENAVASLKKKIPADSVMVLSAAVTPFVMPGIECLWSNLKIANNLMRLADVCRVRHLIYLGTVDVYGKSSLQLPLSEHSRINPQGYYPISKFASECLLRDFCVRSGSAFTVLRLPGVYGRGIATQSVVNRFILAAVRGEAVNISGDGLQKREFLCLDDVGEIIRAAALQKLEGVFNAVSGIGHSIGDVIVTIEAVVGRPLRVVRVPPTAPEVDIVFEASALARVVPSLRFTPLDQGVRHAFSYFQAQP